MVLEAWSGRVSQCPPGSLVLWRQAGQARGDKPKPPKLSSDAMLKPSSQVRLLLVGGISSWLLFIVSSCFFSWFSNVFEADCLLWQCECELFLFWSAPKTSSLQGSRSLMPTNLRWIHIFQRHRFMILVCQDLKCKWFDTTTLSIFRNKVLQSQTLRARCIYWSVQNTWFHHLRSLHTQGLGPEPGSLWTQCFWASGMSRLLGYKEHYEVA